MGYSLCIPIESKAVKIKEPCVLGQTISNTRSGNIHPKSNLSRHIPCLKSELHIYYRLSMN